MAAHSKSKKTTAAKKPTAAKRRPPFQPAASAAKKPAADNSVTVPAAVTEPTAAPEVITITAEATVTAPELETAIVAASPEVKSNTSPAPSAKKALNRAAVAKAFHGATVLLSVKGRKATTVAIQAKHILSFKQYDDRLVCVTVDGQKLTLAKGDA